MAWLEETTFCTVSTFCVGYVFRICRNLVEKGVIEDIARPSTAAKPETIDDHVNCRRDAEPVIPLAMIERGLG